MAGIWENVLASSLVVLAFIAILGSILGITNYRGMKKKRQHFEDLHKRLSNGQKVMLNSGIYGKISNVNEETVDMEVKSGAVFTVSRYAISEIVSDDKHKSKIKSVKTSA